MHVKAVDLSHLFAIVIMIFGRAVLAEAVNPPIGSGGQHPATSGSLKPHSLAPIANSVRAESLAVPRLARTQPIRRLPGNQMQVP
jgi:hypothetical protein